MSVAVRSSCTPPMQPCISLMAEPCLEHSTCAGAISTLVPGPVFQMNTLRLRVAKRLSRSLVGKSDRLHENLSKTAQRHSLVPLNLLCHLWGHFCLLERISHHQDQG